MPWFAPWSGQTLPLSFTSYGNVGVGSVTNAVGWLNLAEVEWTTGDCPYDVPWFAEWWVWALIAVGVVAVCVAWWRVRRCLRASWEAQQQRAAPPTAAGAAYQKMGGAEVGGGDLVVGYGYGAVAAEATPTAAVVPIPIASAPPLARADQELPTAYGAPTAVAPGAGGAKYA